MKASLVCLQEVKETAANCVRYMPYDTITGNVNPNT